MTRTRKKPQTKTSNNNLWIIAGVAVVVLSIILIKGQMGKAKSETSSQASENSSAAAVAQAAPETPEEQFNRLYGQKKPVFAFFHSNNCQLCLDMIAVVDEVYPEYEGKVALVDINVYDEVNQNLLQQFQIRAIPTEFFFNSNGEIFSNVGLMSRDQLREALEKIAGE